CICVYTAFFFLIDSSIDGTRLLPASFCFLFLFVSTRIFSGICEFKGTKRLAIPAFLSLLACELFTKLLTPNGAVIIYETPLITVIAASLLGLGSAVLCMLCMRVFLLEINALSITLGFGEVPIFIPWVAYCAQTAFRTVPFALPYLYSTFYLPRLIAAAVFVWCTVRAIAYIYNKELERCILL
ncbi:MAG: hypothetical protein J6R49_05745, partial [Clostridia bacterium]|nr:hypothetical protein [Clostridia bacterium]